MAGFTYGLLKLWSLASFNTPWFKLTGVQSLDKTTILAMLKSYASDLLTSMLEEESGALLPEAQVGSFTEH